MREEQESLEARASAGGSERHDEPMSSTPPTQPRAMGPPRKLYKIGEVMRYSGLTRQTIHNYTMLGLITEEERTPSGHRLYGEGVFYRLQRIQELKKRMSLKEIRDALERGEINRVPAVPRWMVMVAASLAVLLAPLALMTFGPGKSGARSTVGSDAERVARLVSAIDSGKIREARNHISGGLELSFPSAAYKQFVNAIERYHQHRVTRDGIYLNGELLYYLLRHRIPCESFDLHLRRLRHQAVLFGGLDFLDEIAGPIMSGTALLRYSPRSGIDAMQYQMLFGRWEAALATFRRIPRKYLLSRSTSFDAACRPLAMLARIASASLSDDARAEFRAFWDSMQEHFQFEGDQRARLRNWLTGIEKYYAPVSPSSDRGSTALAAAYDSLNAGITQSRIRVDLARALREEAVFLHQRLAAEFDGHPVEQRARKLFLIGWGAVRLGDRAELDEVEHSLQASGNARDSNDYWNLLLGAWEIRSGEEAGPRRVQSVLDRRRDLLSAREREAWRSFARDRRIPVPDAGAVLFETGKLWSELRSRDRTWLARSVERIDAELAGSRDLGYLTFLQGLLDYHDGRLDAVVSGLTALLDDEPPAGLSRGEIASLVVLAETRAQRLGDIEQRRLRALEILEPFTKLNDQTRDVAARARVLSLRIAIDTRGAAYFEDPEALGLFDSIVSDLEAKRGDLSLLESWLELAGDLQALSDRERSAGRLQSALSILRQCHRLGHELPLQRRAEGVILRGLAERNSRQRPQDVDGTAALWMECAEAFFDSASDSFGDSESYFDAGQAFLAAGDLDRARTSFDSYVARKQPGADEKRYWLTQLSRAQVARELGNGDGALSIIEAALADSSVGSHRFPLLMEKGRVCEDQKDLATALACYESLYEELLPTNEIWLDALHRKSRILESLPEDQQTGDGTAPLRAWEELASRLGDRRLDPRLAEALFRMGEARILSGELQRAQRDLQTLVDRADEVMAESLPPSHQESWLRFSEKGWFGLANAHFLSDRYAKAGRIYEESVARFPESPLVPWAYHQLGECAVRRGYLEDAIRYYELGRRRVAELPEYTFTEVPFEGRDFWLRNFQQKIQMLEGARERQER